MIFAGVRCVGSISVISEANKVPRLGMCHDVRAYAGLTLALCSAQRAPLLILIPTPTLLRMLCRIFTSFGSTLNTMLQSHLQANSWSEKLREILGICPTSLLTRPALCVTTANGGGKNHGCCTTYDRYVRVSGRRLGARLGLTHFVSAAVGCLLPICTDNYLAIVVSGQAAMHCARPALPRCVCYRR